MRWPPRLPRPGFDAGAATLLYLLALWPRLTIWHAPPYGDEGTYFHLARYFNAVPVRVHHLYPETWWEGRHLVWLFPLNPLLLAPGASISFDAYRLNHILLTSLLAPAMYLLVRSHRVPRAWSLGPALVVAAHPHFVAWGVLTLPDSMMTVALAAAFTAEAHKRRTTATLLSLAAAWIKETAFVAVAFLLLIRTIDSFRHGTSRLRPFRLAKPVQHQALALAIMPAPFLLFLAGGGPVPGGWAHNPLGNFLDHVFLSGWLLFPMLGGLAIRRCRRAALIGLLFPAFFIVYRIVLGRSVEAWYMTAPAYFALFGATAALYAFWLLARRSQRRSAPWVAGSIAVAFAVIMTVQVFAEASPRKGDFTMPFSRQEHWGLFQELEYHEHREPDLKTLLGFVEQNPNATWFFFDVYPPTLQYPLSHVVPRGRFAYSYDIGLTQAVAPSHRNLTMLADAIEATGTLTVMDRLTFALNEAVREVYRGCELLDTGSFMVLDGPACGGREDALRAAVRARGGPEG